MTEIIQVILGGITAIVVAATPIMVAYLGYQQKKNAEASASRAESVRTALVNTTTNTHEKLDAIVHAGNSDRDRLLGKIETLTHEVLRLNDEKARREQRDLDDAR